ncbi:MAG TPA: zf-HC2 domain-containing protein [Vicinamibacterales bacterium]|nr:zf-HC2 domain-containing protein [Vicinamibacterales bacterium]
MCDERERLIEYVYDECSDPERRQVESHLHECPVCRNEIGGLRRVRQDLLAWDVPEHGSVWQPFAPPRVAWSWREVPSWALAAAAVAMFAVGAAGGVATHALVPHEPGDVVVSAAPVQPALTPVVLSEMESRLLGRVRTEMQAWQPVPAGPSVGLDLSAVEARLLERVRAELRESDRRLIDLDEFMLRIGNETARIRTDVNNLQQGVTDLQLVAERGPGGLK